MFWLIHLAKNEELSKNITSFKIPFSNWYITKDKPFIYSDFREWEVYEYKKGIFFNKVLSIW